MKKLILLFASAALISCGSDEPEKPAFTPLNAFVDCQQFVKNKLKSPASAEFNDAYSNAVKQINDTTFDINSFVDSQNGFGALLRANFSCQLVYSPSTGMVNCNNLELKEN